MTAKRVTMRQIADAVGVSRTTVSFVLNNVPGIKISPSTRLRILEVARELNYIPDSAATRLAGGHSGTVALVLRQSPHQVASDRFLMQVLLGVSAAVKDKGFHVLVEPLNPADTSASYGNLVRSRRADGLVVSGPRIDDEELKRVHTEGIPVVMMSQLPECNIPFVDVDNTRGARSAVKHLLDLGHRRIAYISNAPPVYAASLDRQRGYRQALEQAGVSYDEQLVRYGEYTDESGTRAMADLLKLGKPPTAAFVASDVVALGALAAARSAGLRVPEDVALVGFDDIPLVQHIDPPLTSVRLPAYGLGWGAGEMLMRLILEKDKVASTQVLLETELVIRESCGWKNKGKTAE
ncbi:MAG: LacI family DNA-binding transcriptional regulator [Anaerolineae bacterium]|nr:LacI family DNA-binding transcriptional regulator [Anaerolineae bacterium]